MKILLPSNENTHGLPFSAQFEPDTWRAACKWLASPEQTNGAKQQYLDKLECLGLVGQNYRKYSFDAGLEIGTWDVQFLLLWLPQPGRMNSRVSAGRNLRH